MSSFEQGNYRMAHIYILSYFVKGFMAQPMNAHIYLLLSKKKSEKINKDTYSA